ncbi:MAG: hypothetical protein SFU53_07085 [Terrimicrobiaceae bacterium]|nr:hypothetical protein [Terrimicrobiaceae bacterium]
MATKTKPFDAVIESRKWKEAVARETAGMTREQLLAYFDREKTLDRMRQARERAAKRQTASS